MQTSSDLDLWDLQDIYCMRVRRSAVYNTFFQKIDHATPHTR